MVLRLLACMACRSLCPPRCIAAAQQPLTRSGSVCACACVSTCRGIFYREHAAGMYRVLPYILAETLVELPFLLGQTIIYSLLVYW